MSLRARAGAAAGDKDQLGASADTAGGDDGDVAPTVIRPPPPGTRWESFMDWLIITAWLGSTLLHVIMIFVALFSVPSRWALWWIGGVGVLDLLPLRVSPPRWARRFCRRTMHAFGRWCRVTMIFEDADAFKAGQAYVIGFEPHSVLPVHIARFNKWTPHLPPGLANTRILVSSAAFWQAVCRHFWWWLGCRPVAREAMGHLLRHGVTCVLNPGGVHEMVFMDKDVECVLLRKRFGFVRMAIQHGAPLVPAFAFGQSDSMSYFRPLIDGMPKSLGGRALAARIARKIKFMPLIAWGYGPSPVPKQVPVMVVVGKPIPVPHELHPSREQVAEYLQTFISAMQELFDKHKVAAGYANARLEVH